MKVQLFGVGVKSESPAITAQQRINCFVEPRQEEEKTRYALIRRPGLKLWKTFTGSQIRGIHVMDSIPVPLVFVCVSNALYSVDTSGTVTLLGNITTTNGRVYMADDGQRLVLVDGQKGWVYNTSTATLTIISSGNFTAFPGHVAWQDTYFFVIDTNSNQFQLSANNDPLTWPALNIAFTQSFPGNMSGCMSYRSQMVLFADYFTEFWQDTGSPSFPYSRIPGSMAEFGAVNAGTLVRMEDTVFAVCQSKAGGIEVGYINGYNRRKVSNDDIEFILNDPSAALVSNSYGFGTRYRGHPWYGVTSTVLDRTLVYDALSTIWSDWQTSGGRFIGNQMVRFGSNILVPDDTSGNIYTLDDTIYTDNGTEMAMEVTSRHIWNDDKYIGIKRVQIDVESGVGQDSALSTTVVDNPVLDLLVSKDGGNSFNSVGYQSMGQSGEYTQRLVWNSLGAARDWVLRLRITDPCKVVITGATAEMEGGPF